MQAAFVAVEEKWHVFRRYPMHKQGSKIKALLHYGLAVEANFLELPNCDDQVAAASSKGPTRLLASLGAATLCLMQLEVVFA